MKRFTCALLSLILIVSLAGCGGKGTIPGMGGGASSSSGISAEDGYGEGRMGDTMHTYFFDYTVNSAYTCADYNGYAPASGNKLLVAEVTVKNTVTESIEMYDTDFQVQWGGDGEDDFDYPITCYVDPVSDEQLPGIYDLGVNETKTGMLVYEVPEDSKDFSISHLELFDDGTEEGEEGDTFFVFFTAKDQA